MNLHALRIFNEVALTGSVTQAANKLLLSQPAVTAQIRNLERELGLKLLAASGRAIRLTVAGERLAAHAERLFRIEAEIESDIEAMKRGLQGLLIVHATELPIRTVLPYLLVKFKERYPLIDVQLHRASSSAAFQCLTEHHGHAAIVCGERGERNDLEAITLFEDELVVVVPRGHKLAGREATLNELAEVPFVVREHGSYTRERLFDWFREAGKPGPVSGLTVDGLTSSIEAVKAGYGAALVPALAVRDELRKGELSKVAVSGMALKHPIRLYRRKDEELMPASGLFMSFMKEEIRRMPGEVEAQ